MKIDISTHQGILYSEEIDYAVIATTGGEFAILKDHIPVVDVISDGFVKLVKNDVEFFVAILNGIVEFHQNHLVVLAQEAHIGRDRASAAKHLGEVYKERLNKNRQEQGDLTQKEKELKEHIKESKAGQL